MKAFVIKYWTYLKNFWYWLSSFWKVRYTVTVSYDSQWGNEDDQVYYHVKKIIKANFKELKFRDENKKTVHLRGMNGLKYKIEDE